VASAGLLALLRTLAHRPPDDDQQGHDRHLEDEHEPDEAPVHVRHHSEVARPAHARGPGAGDRRYSAAARATPAPGRSPPYGAPLRRAARAARARSASSPA